MNGYHPHHHYQPEQPRYSPPQSHNQQYMSMPQDQAMMPARRQPVPQHHNQQFPYQHGPMPATFPPDYARQGQRKQKKLFKNSKSRQSAPQDKEEGGLLSKLKRKPKQQSGTPPTAASMFSLPSNSQRNKTAASQSETRGGILQALTNPDSLSTMLDNTQKVLQTAESFGPLIQQYGPMLKGIPNVMKYFTGGNDGKGTEHSGAVQQGNPEQPEKKPPEPTQASQPGSDSFISARTEPLHIGKKGEAQARQSAAASAFSRDGESRPRLFV
ncbi:MAG: VrrA/YqfQ family protein [Bacillus sp. (in: firmicutes)]